MKIQICVLFLVISTYVFAHGDHSHHHNEDDPTHISNYKTEDQLKTD